MRFRSTPRSHPRLPGCSPSAKAPTRRPATESTDWQSRHDKGATLMAKAVGIDLGTTNSVIAAWEGGEATVIPNAEGARTTPSVVAFTESGERLGGQLGRRQAILNPKGTIYSAKRFIGRRYGEVESEIHAVSFDVVEGPDGSVRFKVRNKPYAPEEVS